ncbi:MAG: EAL domain-containing response regulator [Azospirillaceae bacterium]
MHPKDRLLIVDEQEDSRRIVGDVASHLGYLVGEAGGGDELLGHLRSVDPTVVMLELKRQTAANIAMLRRLAANDCRARIIIAGEDDGEAVSAASEAGASLALDMFDTLVKPLSVPRVTSVLRTAMTLPSISVGDLRAAIATRAITAYYQPKVDIRAKRTPRLAGLEALARWTLPSGERVSPEIFVALAEREGLIDDLTELILDQVLAQQRRWIDAGMSIPVAVNFSRTQLADRDLPDRLADRLARAGVPPHLFTAEITEQVAIAEVSTAIKVLTRLRRQKIGVALDDFGAGYSSLVELYRLPLSELKLDRSLIVDIDQNGDARKVVQALVSLANQLRLPVCAEGVETIESLDFLRGIGCRQAQGFVFAPPLPSAAFAGDGVARMLANGLRRRRGGSR